MALPTITPAPIVQRRAEILLPLTTIFTPPDNCLTAPFTLQSVQTDSEPRAWRDSAQTYSSCYPSSFSSLQNNWNWYSPGVCPSGYNVAQSRSWYTNSAALTQAWCCPEDFTISGHSMSGENYQYCTSSAADASALSIDGDSTLFTSLPSFIAMQWPLSIEWASSDLPNFTPQSAPILVAAETTIYSLPSNVVVGTASAMPFQTSDVTSQPQTTALSTGAKAGIGVGVAVAAVLAAIGLAFWLLSRRKAQREDADKTLLGQRSEDPSIYGGKVELPGDGRPISSNQAVEMNNVGHSPQEMEAPMDHTHVLRQLNRSPIEMAGDYQPIEALARSPLKQDNPGNKPKSDN